MADDALSGAGTGAAAGSALGPWGAAAGAVIGGVAGFLGGSAKAKARARAARELAALKKRYEYLAKVAPTLTLEQSQAAGAEADPRFIQAQLASIDKMQKIVEQDGLTSEDRANIENINEHSRIQEQGQRQAILQNAAAKGLTNSNLNYAAQLQASQNSANQAATQQREVAAMAQKRALQAALATGQLGTSMRAQSFGEQFAKGNAQDAVNKFNSAMKDRQYQNQVNALTNQSAVLQKKLPYQVDSVDTQAQTNYDTATGAANAMNNFFDYLSR